MVLKFSPNENPKQHACWCSEITLSLRPYEMQADTIFKVTCKYLVTDLIRDVSILRHFLSLQSSGLT